MALKEFILEQLYVAKKSVEDLKNQQQAPENSPLFESLKEEIVYLRAESKNKTEIIKVLSENRRYKNDEIPRMINDSLNPENKTQSKANVSTKPDMSPGNDHDTTVTQNSESVGSKRNNHKEKEPTASEDKKNIFILGGSMVKHVEGWKLSKNVDRKDKVYVRSFSSAKVKCMKDYVKTFH